MVCETHFDCPICENRIRIEHMTEHILDHFEEECEDFSLTVKKNKF